MKTQELGNFGDVVGQLQEVAAVGEQILAETAQQPAGAEYLIANDLNSIQD